MIIYAAIIFGLFLINIGAKLQDDSAGGLFDFLIILPIFGRIFGWW